MPDCFHISTYKGTCTAAHGDHRQGRTPQRRRGWLVAIRNDSWSSDASGRSGSHGASRRAHEGAGTKSSRNFTLTLSNPAPVICTFVTFDRKTSEERFRVLPGDKFADLGGDGGVRYNLHLYSSTRNPGPSNFRALIPGAPRRICFRRALRKTGTIRLLVPRHFRRVLGVVTRRGLSGSNFAMPAAVRLKPPTICDVIFTARQAPSTELGGKRFRFRAGRERSVAPGVRAMYRAWAPSRR